MVTRLIVVIICVQISNYSVVHWQLSIILKLKKIHIKYQEITSAKNVGNYMEMKAKLR